MSDSSDFEEPLATLSKKRKISLESTLETIKRVRFDELVTVIKDFDQDRPDFRDMSVANMPVDRREFRRVGPYILGPKIGSTPVDNIVQYLAKKEGTNEFVQLKILILSNDGPLNEVSVLQDRLGKMLLYNELSLLKILEGQKGVIKCRGLFTDKAYEEDRVKSHSRNSTYTGHVKRRLILALDCYTPHEFCEKSKFYIDLQQHLLKVKKLRECEYLTIFRDIVSVVESFHNCDIIHRDLKLGNIVLNLYSNKVTIVNFCLGHRLHGKNDLMTDQQGSPAYISPEVLSGKPYKGKPIDIWALGVILFMMVYGHFPFYESSPTMLFKKIRAGKFSIPLDLSVSFETQDLIRSMLDVNVNDRLTASQVLASLDKMLAYLKISPGNVRGVPNTKSLVEVPNKRTSLEKICRRHEHSDQMVPQGEDETITSSDYRSASRRRETKHTRTVSTSGTASRELSAVPFHQLMAFEKVSPPTAVGSAPTGNLMSPRNALPQESNVVVQQMQNLSLRRTINAVYLRNRYFNRIRMYETDQTRHHRTATSTPPPLSPDNNPVLPGRRSVASGSNLISPSTLSATIQMVPMSPRLIPNRMVNDMVRWAIASEPIASLPNTIPNTLRHSHRLNRFRALSDVYGNFQSLFAGIRQPVAVQNSQLLSFCGEISFEFARRLTQWLLLEHGDHIEVKRIFCSNHDNVVPKVYLFMMSCGFLMDNNTLRLKRQQSTEHLVMLKALLTRSGYSSNYFADAAVAY